MADDLCRFTRTVEGDHTVVHASGEIDETTSGGLVEACKPDLDQGRSVVLDLAEVTFMGSAGIAALVQLHAHASTLGLRFSIDRPSRIVRRVIELVQLEGILLEGH